MKETTRKTFSFCEIVEKDAVQRWCANFGNGESGKDSLDYLPLDVLRQVCDKLLSVAENAKEDVKLRRTAARKASEFYAAAERVHFEKTGCDLCRDWEREVYEGLENVPGKSLYVRVMDAAFALFKEDKDAFGRVEKETVGTLL